MLKLERGNLQAFCRTCLQRLEATSGTAPKYSIRETPNLMKLLILCTTLNINEDADEIYPQLLCAKCYETLQEFQRFRDTALQSNEMLREIVENEDGVMIAPSDINTQQEKYTIKIKSEDLEDMELVDTFKAEEPEMTSPFYVYDVEEANISNACLNNTKNNVETCDDENTVSSDAQNRSDVYSEEASTSAHAIKRKSNVDGNDLEVQAKKRNLLRVHRRKLRDNTDPFQIPEERFIELFRLSKEIANELLKEISPHMKSGIRKTFIPKTIRLTAALNFYATGSYQREIGQDFVCPISKTMICRIIKEISVIIQDKLMNKYVKFPTALEEQDRIRKRFFSCTGFPGAIGAIDCTHVKLKKPAVNIEHCYRNRKGLFSKNVQLVSDYDLNILGCYARFGGCAEDASIWEQSKIKEYLESRHHRESNTKTWLIGDIEYPLQPWLMTPYSSPENDSQKRFNYCHAKARYCVVRLQGVLKTVFACLSHNHGLLVDPSFSSVIINACCTLHNFRKIHNLPIPDVAVEEDSETKDSTETSNLEKTSLFYIGSEIRDNIVKGHFEHKFETTSLEFKT